MLDYCLRRVRAHLYSGTVVDMVGGQYQMVGADEVWIGDCL